MAKTPLTSTVFEYLKYQAERGRKTTCQIQGAYVSEEQRDFSEVLKHFKTPPSLRKGVWNLLDNPLEYDLQLLDAFNAPQFITERDLLEWGMGAPKDPHLRRNGVKQPSIRRWMLVSEAESVTGFHRDIWGLWTLVEVQTGEKFWAWPPQCQETVDVRKKYGAFKSVSKFPRIFALLLRKGDALIMAPGEIHAVVTPTDACALGMHFQMAETLDQTVVLGKADITTQKGFVNDKRNIKPFLTSLVEVTILS